MVFRWLFGSSDARGSESAEVERDNENEYTTSGDDHALGPGDSTPNALEDLSRPLKVALNAIPAYVVDIRPELKLSEYDMSRGQYARNVLAMTHNAVRVEMADMWGDILPCLQPRCGEGVANPLTQADADDVRLWWSGFARFVLTASLVDDMVSKKAFDDIHVGFDKELKLIEKSFQKVQEKNNVYLELAVRKMAKAVDQFENDFSTNRFSQLVDSWQALVSILADIYSESEGLVEAIDRWVRNPFEYKDLEKQAAKIFTSKKRWGEDESKRGEMIIMLCRWVGTEDLMREWMYRNLTKKELRNMDRWMDDYRENRLAIIDRFHRKKL